MRRIVAGLGIALCLMANAYAAVWYVDKDNAGTQNGASWATAFTGIQQAVDAAFAAGGTQEVWVAEGTYTATTDPVVTMKENVHIYGGFIGLGPGGNETTRGQRNWTAHVTTIDGQNARRCVIGANTATLDGFTVKRGYVTYSYYSGGGYGAGMYNSSSSPTVTDCTFSGNSAYGGGGMYNYSSAPTLTNCAFFGNSASSSVSGGGIYNAASSPTVTNCTFSGNSTDGMYNYSSSSPTVTNCTFFGNSSNGMYNYASSSPTLTNCIFWGNTSEGIYDLSSTPTVTYCDVQGASLYAGTGNIMSDPLFLDAVNGDLRLGGGSPCIDTGTSSGAPATDILGDSRPKGAGIDMGAYEATEFQVSGGMFISQGRPGGPYTPVSKTYTLTNRGTGAIAWTAAKNVPWLDLSSTGGNLNPGASVDVQVSLNSQANALGVGQHPGILTFTGGTITEVRDVLLRALTPEGAVLWFVDKDNTSPTQDGGSWATAFTSIQQGVDAASAAGGGEAWVAEGTYTATTDPVVTMRDNVRLYGGFAGLGAGGNETNRGQRVVALHITTIDGQNARRGVIGANNATLDGFVIAHGYTSGNYGGGMYNEGVSPTVANCMFSYNSTSYGGGTYIHSASPTLTNCIFVGNSAAYGGGVYNDAASPTLVNCTFGSNVASYWAYGAAVFNANSSSPILTNCILWDSLSGGVTEIYNSGTNNPLVTYCDVQGGYGGVGNINVDPLFVGLATDNLQLRRFSPCIDTGTATGAPGTDIAGVTRPQGAGVDMGALEAVYGPYADMDEDGLPDSAEAAEGCNPAVADAALYATIDNPSSGASFLATPIVIGGRISSPQVNVVFLSLDGGVTYTQCATISGLNWTYSFAPASEGLYSIRAKALNIFDGFTLSEVIDITYNSSHPEAVIALPIPNARVRGTVSISGTARGGGAGFYRYVLDYVVGTDPNAPSGWQPITTSTAQVTNAVLGSWNTASLTEGPYVVRLAADDGVNPVVRTHAIVYMDRDTTPPGVPSSLTITGAVLPGIVANGGIINVTGTAPANCYVDTATLVDQNGNSIQDVSSGIGLHFSGTIHGSFALAGTSATQVALMLRVKDIANNAGAWGTSRFLTVDNSPPTVTIGFPPDTTPVATVAQAPTVVSGTAMDIGLAGVQRVEFSPDNGTTWFTASGTDIWSYSWTPAVTGAVTLQARAGDRLGNVTSPVVTRNISVNITRPIASISSPTPGRRLNAGVVFPVTGTAAPAAGTTFTNYVLRYAAGYYATGGFTQISTGTSPVTGGALGSWNTAGLVPGPYTLQLVSNGQSGATQCNVPVTILPALSLSGIPDATLPVNGAIEDFVHLPSYASAATGDVEAMTYTITGNTQPSCGVTIDTGRNIDIQPTAGWQGTSTVTVLVDAGGGLTAADTFIVAVGVQSVWYVDKDNSATTKDGLSWASAFTTIQEGVDAAFAAGGGEVWVAEGTYTATTDPVVTMKANVSLFGGFIGNAPGGNETSRDQRNWTAHVTTIDGETARRCVLGANSAALDGFTVTRGYTPYSYYSGGYGGGMSNSSCSPTVTNCTFSGNSASGGAGGMYNYSSSSVVTNCAFSGNSSIGMYNASSSPTVINCTFSGNSSEGMYNYSSSSPTVTNCTFFGNSSNGIYNYNSSSPVLTNCILWGNTSAGIDNSGSSTPVVAYCDIQGASLYAGTGNIMSDPLFVDATNGDFALRFGSPCVNTGTAVGAPATDILGKPRPVGGGVDMGAYELQALSVYSSTGFTSTGPQGGPFSPASKTYTLSNNGSTAVAWTAAKTAGWLDLSSTGGMLNPGASTDVQVSVNAQANSLAVGPHTDSVTFTLGTVVELRGVTLRVLAHWYVDKDNTGAQDGTSWATAFTTIQQGVDAAAAASGGEVWVAEGVYIGFNTGGIVTMRPNVSLFGGFAGIGGNETLRSQRDWTAHVATIDGENACAGVVGANNATLDGFTVTRGSSSSGGMSNSQVSPTVTNCTFSGNSQYGMLNESSSSPTVTNCTFSGNSQYGMLNESSSSPAVTNCTFSNNSSYGMYNYYSSPAVTNCTFSRNSSYGMYNYSSSPAVTNCILWGNTGAGIGNPSSTPVVTYCDVQGTSVYAGTGNILGDPLFQDAANGDLQLRYGSPCIDTGTSVGAPATDITGRIRPAGGGVDIGAYESPELRVSPATGFTSTGSQGGPFSPASKTYTLSNNGTAAVAWTATKTAGWLDLSSAGGTLNPGASTDVQVSISAQANSLALGPYTDTVTFTLGTLVEPRDVTLRVLGHWYVDRDNTGTQNGTSWATAFISIQQGVDAAFAAGGGEVWVAEGTYTSTSDPVVTMKANVHLYGGFIGIGSGGNETSRGLRNWATHVATIDGENARRCVLGANTATLDGFTITRGHAPSSQHGDGMYNNTVAPTVANCMFLKNGSISFTTSSGGEGMYNSGASPAITNCVFFANLTGMGNSNASPTVMNCTFQGNMGYGINNLSSSNAVITNCIVWGGLYAGMGGSGIIYNSSSAPVVTYCDVQGGYTGTGNINSDPLFADATNGDVELRVASPCVNTGTVVGAPATDIVGKPRPVGAGVDMGAYELQALSVSPSTGFAPWGTPGGPFTPPAKTFLLGNAGTTPVAWTVAKAAPWLDVSSAGGTVNPGESASVIVSLNAVANGLSLGQYPETLTFTLGTLTETRNVTLRVVAAWYVDKDNTSGTQNGTSWATAFTSIQQGVDAASAAGGGEVWVAERTYTATTDPVVTMKANVSLYGGFVGIGGNETLRSQRDWRSHVSAIDGENTRSCIWGANDATLDGFTITRGNAGTSQTQMLGGGMTNLMVSPNVVNCTFSANSGAMGGGMLNFAGSPGVTNCTFSANSGPFVGGILNWGGSPNVVNCTFSGNSSSGTSAYAGGMANIDGSPKVANCVFYDNTSSYAAGIFNAGETASTPSSPLVTNCTFYRKTGATGYEIYNYDQGGSGAFTSVTITNCIIWGVWTGSPIYASGNATVTYSCVKNGYAGTGNVSGDPVFAAPDSGDFRLRAGSPCLDTGTATGAPATDIMGVPRPQGTGIDMGAYEGVVSGIVVTLSAPSTTLTNSGPVTYTVTYSGADTVTLANAHVSLNRTGTANADPPLVSGTGMTRTVTLSNVVGDGALGISIAANTASTTAGVHAPAAGPSQTFTVDNTCGIGVGAPSPIATTSGPVVYTVTYSGADTITLSANDVTLNKSGSANVATPTVQGTGMTRSVILSGITGSGTLSISIAANTASDAVGNDAPAVPSTTPMSVYGSVPQGPVFISTNGGLDFSTWDPNVTLDGVCPQETVEVRVNGSTDGVSRPSSTTWRCVRALSSGPNDFTVVGLDGVGGQLGSDSIRVTRNFAQKPVITTNGGRNFTANRSPVTLEGTCSSDAVEIRVNGSTSGVTFSPAVRAWTFTAALTAGANPFNVTARDSAGHESDPATISVTLNTSAPDTPVIETNGGADFSTNEKPLTLHGDCTVSAAHIQVNGSTSGVTFTSGSTEWSFSTVLTEGKSVFSVVAVGGAGQSSDPAAIAVTLDTVAPKVVSAAAVGLTRVRVAFSEEMANDAGLVRPACYSLGTVASSPNVTGVSRVNVTTVELTTSELTPGTAYTLEVSKVVPTDLAGNLLDPTANTAQFTVPGGVGGSTYYVGGAGASDSTGDGTQAKPWATIAKAMTTVTPFSTAMNPSTIRLAPGTYNEKVEFSAHVAVVGSGPDQTTISYYAEADSLHVVAKAADDTALRDCKLTFPGVYPAIMALLVIDDVRMEINNVLLDGGLNQSSTGVLVSKQGSSNSVISDSTIVNLNDGIWVVDSGVVITRNEFKDIQNNAIFARRPTTKDGNGITPAVGDSTKPCTSGLNRFGAVGRFCLMSLNATEVLAEQNDWGVYTDSLVASKVSGNVSTKNYIGRNLLPGTIVAAVLDAKSELIPSSDNPAVLVTSSTTPKANSTFDGTFDEQSGLFLVLSCPVATYTVKGTATGHVPDSQDVEVQAGQVATSVLHLAGRDEARDINGDVKIDAIDVQLVINGALGLAIDLGLIPDVNRDGKIDAIDVQLVINGALGLPVAR